ncbi:MAG TPA: hypothetical protein VMV74_00330 [Bacteroidales bacterium]|nr:hypothetical protein [Bacteroidales bacterium]
MKASYITAIWIALALSVSTIVFVLAILFDFTLVNSSPYLFLGTIIAAIILLSLLIKRFFTLQVLRTFGIMGGLLISPVVLFITIIPVAFYYLVSAEMEVSTINNSLMALATCIAAVIFFSSMAVYTLPAVAIISEGFEEQQRKKFRVIRTLTMATLSVIIFSVILLVIKSIIAFNTIWMLLLLPVLSLLMVLSFVNLNHEFRGDILHKLSSSTGILPVQKSPTTRNRSESVFRSSLLFQSNYLEIISGNHATILNEADTNYTISLVHAAIRDFDPALIPALDIIAASDRFGESLRHEAAGAVYNIEKYYSDPKQNNDILMQSGIAERTAGARSILLSNRVPMVSEVLRLLHDSNPDIRKIGLAAIGRFGIRDMVDEVLQALSVQGTEKEAYYLLKYFGPDSYKNVIGSYLKHSGSEKMNLMIIRLLGSVQSRDTVSILEDFVGKGTIGVRLMAMDFLRECRFNPNTGQRKKLTETVIELIGNLSEIILLQIPVRKYKFFLLGKALEQEREMNQKLIDSILPFIIGPEASVLLMSQTGRTSVYSARLAAEVIETVAAEPLRGPLLALMDHRTDVEKLRELSIFYPVRELSFHTLAERILSADQNITGIWTKAITLRKVAEGKLVAVRDMLISFLFSPSQILQEEGARAIRNINPEWFRAVAARIPEPARQRTAAIIDQERPEVNMVLDKTRFLNLCFSGIPEERMISLATRMKYSESYDAQSLPGLLTWIVPSENGKSGLYSLSVSDITDFIFHYSEYTDIFVEYIDNRDRPIVLQTKIS